MCHGREFQENGLLIQLLYVIKEPDGFISLAAHVNLAPNLALAGMANVPIRNLCPGDFKMQGWVVVCIRCVNGHT